MMEGPGFVLVYPAFARSMASCRPIPREAPIIRATLSLPSCAMIVNLGVGLGSVGLRHYLMPGVLIRRSPN